MHSRDPEAGTEMIQQGLVIMAVLEPLEGNPNEQLLLKTSVFQKNI
jgi:hypothetical protein